MAVCGLSLTPLSHMGTQYTLTCSCRYILTYHKCRRRLLHRHTRRQGNKNRWINQMCVLYQFKPIFQYGKAQRNLPWVEKTQQIHNKCKRTQIISKWNIEFLMGLHICVGFLHSTQPLYNINFIRLSIAVDLQSHCDPNAIRSGI